MSIRSAASNRRLAQTPGGDDVISELESARLKLATLKIREKLDNVGHLEDIEDKLAAHQVLADQLGNLIQLEEYPAHGFKIRVDIKPKIILNEQVLESSRCQIEKSLHHLKNCFSSIFEALVIVSSIQVPNSPLEREKIGRRTREFEIRFKRNTFEAKQQVLVLRGSVVELALKPKNKNLSATTISKLIRVSRNLTLVWQSYIHHLPFSSGHLYPKSLEKALNLTKTFELLVKELGFNSLDIGVDIKQLLDQFNKFQLKIESDKGSSSATTTRLPKTKPTETSPPLKGRKVLDLRLRLINNLAREKFGSPNGHLSRPKSRSAVSVNSDASWSQRKFVDEENHWDISMAPQSVQDHQFPHQDFPRVPVSDISKPERAESQADKESVLESRPSSIHHRLRHEIKASPSEISRIESSRELLRTPSVILESALHENVIMPDISWHDILSAEKSLPHPPIVKPPSQLQYFDQPKLLRCVSNIDLPDSDLKEILSVKSKAKDKLDRFDVVEDNDLFDFYSVQFVSNFSSHLADEILMSICNEFVNSDLITNLIASELKA